jgi:hypothetical protein
MQLANLQQVPHDLRRESPRRLTLDIEADWDAQLDNCLMNAAAVLAESPRPTTIDEACELSQGWLSIAHAWTQRLDTEDNFVRWVTESVEDDIEVEVE